MTMMDSFTHKIMFDDSVRMWLLDHRIAVQKWMDTRVHPTDHISQWDTFLKLPYLGKALVENYTVSDIAKKEYIFNMMFKRSTISVIIGARNAGKSVLAFWLAEKAHKLYNKKIVTIQSSSNMPSWIEVLEPSEIFSAETDSLIIHDEAAISLNARNAMTRYAKDISGLLAITRHRGLSMIFISQNASMIDLNILRMADCYFFKKLGMEETLRHEKKRSIDLLLQFVRRMMPMTQSETLFTDGSLWYSFENSLPSFWSEDISKAFRKITMTEAVDLAYKQFMGGMQIRQIVRQLKMKGINVSETEVKTWMVAPQKSKRNIKEAEEYLKQKKK